MYIVSNSLHLGLGFHLIIDCMPNFVPGSEKNNSHVFPLCIPPLKIEMINFVRS